MTIVNGLTPLTSLVSQVRQLTQISNRDMNNKVLNHLQSILINSKVIVVTIMIMHLVKTPRLYSIPLNSVQRLKTSGISITSITMMMFTQHHSKILTTITVMTMSLRRILKASG